MCVSLFALFARVFTYRDSLRHRGMRAFVSAGFLSTAPCCVGSCRGVHVRHYSCFAYIHIYKEHWLEDGLWCVVAMLLSSPGATIWTSFIWLPCAHGEDLLPS